MGKVKMIPVKRSSAAKSNSSSVVSEGTLMESETMFSQILSQQTEHFLLENIHYSLREVCEDSMNLDDTVTYFMEESQEMSQYLAVVDSTVGCTDSSRDSVVPSASSGPESVKMLSNGLKTDSEKGGTASGCFGQEACNVEIITEAEGEMAIAEASPVEDFGVVVVPVDTKCSNNFAFSERLNKIYCAPGYNIQLQFTLDPELRKGEQVKMVAFMRFTDPEFICIPVNRCDIHTNRDMVKLRKNPGIPEEEVALIQHVLNSNHPEAVHLVDAESKRFKVSIPMNSAEVKTGEFSRNFQFCCLNSCHGRGKRALLEVVFEIYSNNTLVGKVTKNVRVCALPIRDLDTDTCRLTKNKKSSAVLVTKQKGSSQSERKPKIRSRSKSKPKVRSRSKSKPKVGSSSGSKRKGGPQSENEPMAKEDVKKLCVEQIQAGPSRSDSRKSPSPSATSVKSEESDASESEEPLKQAKWILDHCENENHLMRSLAKGCLKQIQHTHRMMKFAQEHQNCLKKA